jgi:two-component system NtrC family response regulator/two-component system nitrogen regulation response regulator GlnG
MADVLIVDDEASVADAFARIVRFDGHTARVAGSAEDALAALASAVPDLVVMDVRMPGMDGLQALAEMRRLYPDLYVILVTAFGTSQTPIDAIRAGAFDYLTKPLDLDQLRAIIAKALAGRRARQSLDAEAPESQATALVGDSAQMLDVYKRIGRLASHELPALVLGERGTGKDLIVSAIHQNSARKSQPLTVIECPGAPPDMAIETTLAQATGTVHLRDVDGLPLPVQARLLRVLADAGSAATGARGARVVASSAANLPELVRAGAFLADLWDVLAVATVTLPPLRERGQDVALLARAFARRFSEHLGRPIVGLAEDAVAALSSHSWPGNVAELELVIKRACVEAAGDVITAADIQESLARHQPQGVEGGVSLDRAARLALRDRLSQPNRSVSVFHDLVSEVEAALTAEALQVTRGNQVKASELLGLNRATLRKKAGLVE